ncbi:MAG: cyclopropane-fatty-acyl-phospholipid synthase family protein [Xanthobacteraceae bacterium]
MATPRLLKRIMASQPIQWVGSALGAGYVEMLAHARERLRIDIGFVLWDGSTVPSTLPAGAFAIVLADEGVVAALIRRPKLDTILNLWVSARFDLRNGTLFDLVARRPKVRSKDFLRVIDKWLALGVAAKFLFVSRGGPWPLEQLRDDPVADGSESANRENVQYHYDVSNEFYALFLDPEMIYTCAYFVDWADDLATAQRNKLDMSCRRLRLKPGEALLDIGCGWGAFICHAAQHYGVRAHGVTLAQKQYDYAAEKIARLRDYTLVDGSFDKIASIGMFEQVGIDNHPTYFQTVNRLLKPNGLYLHHAISRPAKRDDKAFRKQRPEYAVITRYIFPGGELDHLGMTIANLDRFGFEIHDVEGWREHYARTCRLWHDRLLANKSAAGNEIGSEKSRLWLAYLAGSSIAFERGTVGLFQTLASKRKRGGAGLPPTRADLYR